MDIHGGDSYRNHVAIDFSINVNPLGTPECVQRALHSAVGMCGRYPDMRAEKLSRAVSGMLAVPEEYLLFGNGASELFMAVAHGMKPKKVLIPVPSFYGYEYAAKAADSEIVYYEMTRQNNFCLTRDFIHFLSRTDDVQLLFLANPNNPIGRLLDKGMLMELLQCCAEKGIYVVLDECFIEFCGNQFSMLRGITEESKAFDYLILVRAFTKIFSIPGVRLGYLVCRNKEVRTKISGQLPEWNLSCFAQEAGCACAGQTAFLEETRKYIENERKFMETELEKKGFQVFPSAANFITFYSDKSLYELLLKKGILIRDCSNFRGLGKGFYRTAVKRRKENEILLENL